MDVDTTGARPVEAIEPIHRSGDARAVAEAAYERLLALLEGLEPEDWGAVTPCPGWDVSAIVGHLIGAAKAGASVRENLRQQRWGKRHAARFDGNVLDAANALQVRDHASLSPSERIAAVRAVVGPAVRGRMRVPGVVRRVTVPLDAGGSTAPGMPGRLQLGHLLDVVYTRDVWLHTIDIARATDRPYVPDHPVDARIVEDVVAEWAGRHGRPFVLTLDGPAGGRFAHGTGGGALRLDAIGFCLILSGRAEVDDPDLLVEADAEVLDLLGIRVVF